MIAPAALVALTTALLDWHDRMDAIQPDPTRGGPAIGMPEADAWLWQLGRQRLAAPACPTPPGVTPCRDLYLATQLYEIGGHTALLGDFVTALGADEARLVLTDIYGSVPGGLPDDIRARVFLPADRVHVLAGRSLAERLDQLMAIVRACRPERLFLFHHPQDPLATIVAQPELAGQSVLVHHADATASFGLFIPGVRIIDLNPRALAPTRRLGLTSSLLPLTAPDPGPRPAGFLRRGRLVTASSGSAHKFTGTYMPGYAETVAGVLGATGGWHVHIGPLPAEARARLEAAIQGAGVDEHRFVHVPRTPSVSAALWEHACDVYLASFPVSGARTRAEVLASGTPYVAHARHPPAPGAPRDTDDSGQLVWRTLNDLTALLERLNDPARLVAHGVRARDEYQRVHHPAVFEAKLRNILATPGSP